MGLLAKLKAALKKTRDSIFYQLDKLFTGGVLNDEFYDELEMLLLSADVGAFTTERILDGLKGEIDRNRLRKQEDVMNALEQIVVGILDENELPQITYPAVIMVTGVNGVGKTTAIGKLAKYYKSRKKSVMIAAADTFRAAASDQLEVWADRAGVKIISQGEGADPAAVVFDAIASAKAKRTDVLLVDTAGRLHNKKNLMEELKKISRLIEREYPEAYHLNLIVLDATTGQNAVPQVELFDSAVDIGGIVLTKIDGTAKGGVVLGICGELNVPVMYLGVGEGIDDLEEFDSVEFAQSMLGN